MTVEASDNYSLLYLDLSAAFDAVDHDSWDSSWETLESLRRDWHNANWFLSYLTGRTQVVCNKGELSESSALLTGVL